MSEVKRFKPVINNKPCRPYAYCEENSEGIYVRIDDYEAIKAERDALAAKVAQDLDKLAGAMFNRTLDSGSKQAVAYADCADMVARFAKQLRSGGNDESN